MEEVENPMITWKEEEPPYYGTDFLGNEVFVGDEIFVYDGEFFLQTRTVA